MKRQQILHLKVDPIFLGQPSELFGNKLEEVLLVVLYILHYRDLIKVEGEQLVEVVCGTEVVDPPFEHL